MISDHNVLSDTDDNKEEEVRTQEAIAGAGGESQAVNIDSGNKKKVLYLLSIALNRSNSIHQHSEALFSFETEPWSLLPKTPMHPKNIDYVNEIVRRATLFNISPIPRPSNWNKVQKMEWLQRNPIRDRGNIEFLRNKVFRLEDVLTRKAREQQEMQSALVVGGGGIAGSAGGCAGGRGHWQGALPYLRIIMSLTQDNVTCLFLTRANSRSREELDARNSDTR
jgi:hypothetical protein